MTLAHGKRKRSINHQTPLQTSTTPTPASKKAAFLKMRVLRDLRSLIIGHREKTKSALSILTSPQNVKKKKKNLSLIRKTPRGIVN